MRLIQKQSPHDEGRCRHIPRQYVLCIQCITSIYAIRLVTPAGPMKMSDGISAIPPLGCLCKGLYTFSAPMGGWPISESPKKPADGGSAVGPAFPVRILSFRGAFTALPMSAEGLGCIPAGPVASQLQQHAHDVWRFGEFERRVLSIGMPPSHGLRVGRTQVRCHPARTRGTPAKMSMSLIVQSPCCELGNRLETQGHVSGSRAGRVRDSLGYRLGRGPRPLLVGERHQHRSAGSDDGARAAYPVSLCVPDLPRS
jgi:hypothetical protein